MYTNKKDQLILKNNIPQHRKTKKITQKELGEIVGVSRQTISYIETGEYCPSAKLAFIICIALDAKFEELFYFE